MPISRNALLDQINVQHFVWDVLVVGGGATGLGVALDAVSRGYKTLLIEQSDFAKGTSSRSTKLIHGGVRYLAQGDVRLVREASVERGLLARNAPHLVKNQTFVIPLYSYWNMAKYTMGLKLYDWISGKLSLGSSAFISRKKTIESLPGIKPDGLLGGVMYHDGQFDDSRLAINLVQSIIEHGGYPVNYMKIISLVKGADNIINGAVIEDAESGKKFEVKTRSVVNATGVFVDEIMQMDDASAKKTICVSQGIHLVLDKKFYSSTHALMIPETTDGRVLFAVPWHNKVVVGTTDTLIQAASLEPQALEAEITFVLENISSYLTIKPQRKDILSVFAGLRPLAAPKEGKQKTKEISRSHKIIVSPSMLVTILGGKWTTYRKMGEDAIDRIEAEFNWVHKKSETANMHIHGYAENVNWDDPLCFYGSDRPMIKAGIEQQVRWAVQHEMARTVEDFLSRRTRALLLDARASIRIAPEVARIMANELKMDEQWINNQVTAYSNLANNYILN